MIITFASDHSALQATYAVLAINAVVSVAAGLLTAILQPRRIRRNAHRLLEA